jgi:hypothetical protein
MNDHQDYEAQYWGDCTNTFDEEQKHFCYAEFMGIPTHHYSFDAGFRRIIDIGGGPVSMLLKCKRLLSESKVVDPLRYPEWTVARYRQKGILVDVRRGEDLDIRECYDEAWIYNCLQHTDDPELIINNALEVADTLRIFEWVNIPPHEGHPHELTKKFLDECIGSEGRVVHLNERGCVGEAYYNVYQQ